MHKILYFPAYDYIGSLSVMIEIKCHILQNICKIDEKQDKQELERRSTLENRNCGDRSSRSTTTTPLIVLSLFVERLQKKNQYLANFVLHLIMVTKKIFSLHKRSSASTMYANHNICNFETTLRKKHIWIYACRSWNRALIL